MLVPMTKVQIIGRRSDVGRMVEELHQLGLVEIADARSADAVEELGGEGARAARRGELLPLAAQIDALLAVLPPDEMLGPATRRPLDAGAARTGLERLTSEVAALSRRLDALHDERLVLPSYLEPLRLLLPLVPEVADLDDQ
jgi:vacuolar-type H+-ATPase subunit I/STV1